MKNVINVMTRRRIRNAANATRRACRKGKKATGVIPPLRNPPGGDKKETSCQLGVKSRGIKL